MAAGEWIRVPSRAAAIAAIALLLLTAAVRRRGWILPPLLATALLIGQAEWRLTRLTAAWPAEREARIEAASSRLSNELRAARTLADSLARLTLGAAAASREAGFTAVENVVRGVPLESGVAIFEPNGDARVWGGRFRLLPSPVGDSLEVRLTPYYAVLEVRRHSASGRVAVASVLLAADPAVKDQERTLASRFREKTEVGLLILAPHTAPNTTDVFDYEQPMPGGTRVLFSVQFVPPEQAEAVGRAARVGKGRVAWLLLASLLLAPWLVPAGVVRLLLGLLPLGLAFRAPLGPLLGLPAMFDPRVFSSSFLGPVSQAAGPLVLLGVVLVMLGA
ncbi:MAG: hypothetical protein HOP28_14245, partial [Gemmatimonadales bacterium]|nr:hypothetical protein [Gemmatimonadales bacterium]